MRQIPGETLVSGGQLTRVTEELLFADRFGYHLSPVFWTKRWVRDRGNLR